MIRIVTTITLQKNVFSVQKMKTTNVARETFPFSSTKLKTVEFKTNINCIRETTFPLSMHRPENDVKISKVFSLMVPITD